MKAAMIGLGAMGAHMAANLDKAGLLAAVWNRSSDKAAQLLVGDAVLRAESPAAAAAAADVIVTCVSRDVDVMNVAEAMLPGLKAGATVCDTSTVSAATARTLASVLEPRKVAFLDCPVSGGVEGARKATLAMMVGGDAEALARAKPVLSRIAANIVHMGPNGSGQATKAVNQIMAAGINQAVTEALTFGAAMGLDMEKVIDVVGSGAAANWFLSHRGGTMVAGSYAPGFKVALHHKDLAIAREMVAALNAAPLSVVEDTLRDYAALMRDGHGEDDISCLYRLKMAGFRSGT